MTKILRAITVAAFAAASGAAMAEDVPFKTRLLRDFMPEAFAKEQRAVMGLMKELAVDEASRGAFYPLFQWPASIAKLKVCFFGGSDEVRGAIRDLASD